MFMTCWSKVGYCCCCLLPCALLLSWWRVGRQVVDVASLLLHVRQANTHTTLHRRRRRHMWMYIDTAQASFGLSRSQCNVINSSSMGHTHTHETWESIEEKKNDLQTIHWIKSHETMLLFLLHYKYIFSPPQLFLLLLCCVCLHWEMIVKWRKCKKKEVTANRPIPFTIYAMHLCSIFSINK